MGRDRRLVARETPRVQRDADKISTPDEFPGSFNPSLFPACQARASSLLSDEKGYIGGSWAAL